MKLLVIPKTKQILYETVVDGYLLPLKNFSVSYELQYSLEEIRSMIQTGKEIFVVLNKNIFNAEIKELEEVLISLNGMGVAGVFFYDLSVLSIVKRLDLSLPLIWNQTHMVTNYNTINYYFQKGVHGAMLSNEITLEEMMEIRKKTDALLFANIIYRPIMSFSRRHLLSNYYKYNSMEIPDNKLVIHEKISGVDALVFEEKDGTSFFYGKLVNGLSALPSMISHHFDYGIVDLSCLDDVVGLTCLEAVRAILDGNDNINLSDISEIIGNYTGFLYKKTIYRVKGIGE